MAERKRQIDVGGKKVEATEMPVSNAAEYWNEYLLTDGSVVRLKTVVTEVFKVDGKFDAEGNPEYVLRSTQIVTVSPSGQAKQAGGQ